MVFERIFDWVEDGYGKKVGILGRKPWKNQNQLK